MAVTKHGARSWMKFSKTCHADHAVITGLISPRAHEFVREPYARCLGLRL